MRVYAVRTIADKHPVGFFAVYDFRGLLRAVDDQIDIDECEYQLVGEEGGIVWRQPVDWPMGIDLKIEEPDVEEAFDEQVRRNIHFDGAFDDFIGLSNGKRWRRMIRRPEDIDLD